MTLLFTIFVPLLLSISEMQHLVAD